MKATIPTVAWIHQWLYEKPMKMELTNQLTHQNQLGYVAKPRQLPVLGKKVLLCSSIIFQISKHECFHHLAKNIIRKSVFSMLKFVQTQM